MSGKMPFTPTLGHPLWNRYIDTRGDCHSNCLHTKKRYIYKKIKNKIKNITHPRWLLGWILLGLFQNENTRKRSKMHPLIGWHSNSRMNWILFWSFRSRRWNEQNHSENGLFGQRKNCKNDNNKNSKQKCSCRKIHEPAMVRKVRFDTTLVPEVFFRREERRERKKRRE